MHERASPTVELARAVRQRREHLGLRQDELAALADCSTRFVHAVEHAKPAVQFDKLLALLRALGYGITVRPGSGDVVVDEP